MRHSAARQDPTLGQACPPAGAKIKGEVCATSHPQAMRAPVHWAKPLHPAPSQCQATGPPACCWRRRPALRAAVWLSHLTQLGALVEPGCCRLLSGCTWRTVDEGGKRLPAARIFLYQTGHLLPPAQLNIYVSRGAWLPARPAQACMTQHGPLRSAPDRAPLLPQMRLHRQLKVLW